MKFFNIDFHIGVISDLRNILEKLGHTVTSWNISGHTWVFGEKPYPTDVIHPANIRSLDQAMCDAFYERYKHELGSYDAFITTHYISMSLLYQKFHKPIIAIASTRYEYPFSQDAAKWLWFNDFLRSNIDSGLLVPIANNKYDAAYAEYFTQRAWRVIPNLCAYTQMRYTGKRNNFLYWSYFKDIPGIKHLIERRRAFFRKTLLNRVFRKIFKNVQPSGYRWQDIADFKGVVHLPYNVSVMSIFEQYTANIPLFFPSLDWMRELYQAHRNQGVLSQLSWNQVFGLPPGTGLPGTHIKDPNQYDDVPTMMEWVKLADYYDKEMMPHVLYYDSFEHLRDILKSCDTREVSAAMQRFNQTRTAFVFSRWEDVLNDLRKKTA